MTASKDKGTRAETAVTRYCRSFFPAAERRALHGRQDVGDILLAPGIIIEVKAGKAAQTASLRKIRDWMAETQREVANAGADIGLLVTQRQGLGLGRVEDWECWSVEHTHVTMRSLKDTLELLIHEGYQ